MKERVEQLLPQARKDKLVIENLPEEVLVYDLERDRAHCLNRAAALVWRHCDRQTTVAEMVRILQKELKAPVDVDVVRLALDQLGRSHLLQERGTRPTQTASVSRRELMRRLGGAAVAALPWITSIVVPTAIQAASCAHTAQSCQTIPCCAGCSCDGTSHLCVGVC